MSSFNPSDGKYRPKPVRRVEIPREWEDQKTGNTNRRGQAYPTGNMPSFVPHF